MVKIQIQNRMFSFFLKIWDATKKNEITNQYLAIVYLMDIKGIELVSEVKVIHKSMHIIVIVIGCLMIFQSKPPSYNRRNIKTSMTPKSRGSVGSVNAAYSENSTVSENGVKNKMK